MANAKKQFKGKGTYKTVRITYEDWYALKLLGVHTGEPMIEWLSVAVPLLYTRYPEYTKHLPDDYAALVSELGQKPGKAG